VGAAGPGLQLRFRRNALIAIGSFDEFFTYYHDETDVCLRLARAGFTVLNLPTMGPALPGRLRTPPQLLRPQLHVIARSDTYFAMKNGADRLPRRIVKTVAAAPRKHYAEQIVEWRRTGKISRRHWARLMVQLYAGAASGFWSGLTPAAKVRGLPDAPAALRVLSPADDRATFADCTPEPGPPRPAWKRRRRPVHLRPRARASRAWPRGSLFCRSEKPLVRESLEFVIHGISDPSAAPLAPVGDRPVLARNLSHALTVARTLAELEAQGTPSTWCTRRTGTAR